MAHIRKHAIDDITRRHNNCLEAVSQCNIDVREHFYPKDEWGAHVSGGGISFEKRADTEYETYYRGYAALYERCMRQTSDK